MFLETLVDFITLHRDDLQDWLFVLLTQLLKKMGADLLGSVQAKVQKALDVTRSELTLKLMLLVIGFVFLCRAGLGYAIYGCKCLRNSLELFTPLRAHFF